MKFLPSYSYLLVIGIGCHIELVECNRKFCYKLFIIQGEPLCFCLFLRDGENIISFLVIVQPSLSCTQEEKDCNKVCLDFLGRKTLNPIYVQ